MNTTYMSSRTLHLESTWYICTKQLTGGVISPTIIHPLNLWFVSRAIEFFMAMSHSGLEMRSFLNPFSNWHTSAPQPWMWTQWTWWLLPSCFHLSQSMSFRFRRTKEYITRTSTSMWKRPTQRGWPCVRAKCCQTPVGHPCLNQPNEVWLKE